MNDVPPPAESAPASAPGTPPRRSLLANTLYALLGNGFYHTCQLGVVVLLAKFAAPEIQGQYFLALAIGAPIILLFGLELRGALVADAGQQFTVGSYLVLRQAMLVPAGVLLLVILLGLGLSGTRPTYLLILGGVFAVRLLWSAGEAGWGTFQRRERLDLLAAAVSLRGVAMILPFAILVPLYGWLCSTGRMPASRLAEGTAAAVWLAAAGTGLILYLFDRARVWDRRRWNLSWSGASLRALAWQTLPLGVVALTISLCDSFPRYVIEGQPNGSAQLGYFGALAYITLAGNMVILQALTAAANRLALYYQRDLRAFLRLGAGLIGLAVGIGGIVLVLAFVFGQWILRVLYTPEYAAYEHEFHIIVGAHCLALLTNIFGTATTQMRLFWVQVPVQIVTLIVTVIAAVILIPRDPIHGAALTMLIRATVQLTLYAGCVAVGLARRPQVLARRRYRETDPH